jgi:hypothetical protein
MSFEVVRTDSFDKDVKSIVRNYPKSRRSIERSINSLAGHPGQGDEYPGFGPFQIRKVRMPLKEYNIGKSNGLRLIFLVLNHSKRIIPVTLYKKNEVRAEIQVRLLIRDRLRELLYKRDISSLA